MVKHGKRFNRDEIKHGILNFLLFAESRVLEPELRAHLKDEFGIVDSTNIKRHLKDLKDLKCINKYPGAPGGANEWDVTTILNLKNIDANFKSINLHKQKKAISIILKMQHFNESSSLYSTFEQCAILSKCFFELFLNNSPQKVYDRWVWVFLFDNPEYIEGELLNTFNLLFPCVFKNCLKSDLLNSGSLDFDKGDDIEEFLLSLDNLIITEDDFIESDERESFLASLNWGLDD